MRTRLIRVASGVVLSMGVGIAYSQTTQQNPSSSDQSSMSQTAAPSTSDSSYGGSPARGAYDSGRTRYNTACIAGLSCDIFQGS
ncbi:hypothetical protein [Caballeronia humi]|uniref:Lipoprotein n=1 Tax=Caballeronia humi TaxID=326474 RepID=A0A158J6W4_9BURK|nr:hypothetical protein [Caballeronia humi]SAL64644.1 hypothetical protein AWB65_06068 [Caballeronia humi]